MDFCLSQKVPSLKVMAMRVFLFSVLNSKIFWGAYYVFYFISISILKKYLCKLRQWVFQQIPFTNIVAKCYIGIKPQTVKGGQYVILGSEVGVVGFHNLFTFSTDIITSLSWFSMRLRIFSR